MNIQRYNDLILKRPHHFFFYGFVIFVSADGMLIPIGRNFTAPQVFFLVLFGILLLASLYKADLSLKVLPKPLLLVSLWTLMMLISILAKMDNPIYPERTTGSLLQSYELIGYSYLIWQILNFVLLFVVYRTASKGEVFINAIRLLLISSLVFSLYGIYQYGIVKLLGSQARNLVYILKPEYLFGPGSERLTSFGREPLYFANYLSCVMAILFSLLIKRNGWRLVRLKKRMFWAILIVNSVAFILTFSTGGMIALIGACTVIIFFYLKFDKSIDKKRIWLFISLGGFIFGGLLLLDAARIVNKLTRFTDLSGSYLRIVSILEGLQWMIRRPIMGIGLGSANYMISTQQIHNAYISIGAEIGVIGLTSFMALLLYLLRILLKTLKISVRYKPIVIGLIGGFAALTIQWLSFYAYVVAIAWLMFGLILSAPNAIRKLERVYVRKHQS